VAPDGLCYGLDIFSDTALGLKFHGRGETIQIGPTGARFANIYLLLNSKARSYLAWDNAEKRAKDGRDIGLILDCMLNKGIQARPAECKQIFTPQFWTAFTTEFPALEEALVAVGNPPKPVAGTMSKSGTGLGTTSQNVGNSPRGR
jgi:hypothetical protein